MTLEKCCEQTIGPGVAPGGGGGGQTNTVSGSNGITNTGDNTDAILTPTYGTAADTICEGNDPRLNVFGQDYQRAESLAESQTTLATYQDKVSLTTPALTGTYRVAWGAMVTNTDKVGQVQLYNSSDAAVVGFEIPFRPKLATDDYPTVGAVHEITFTGSAKTFIVQYKDGAGGNTQSIKDAWIEVWRVS